MSRSSGPLQSAWIPSVFLRGGALMLIRLAGVGLTIVATILITRGLGVEGFGRYAFLFAIVTLASLPAQFGLPALAVRETAAAVVNEDFSSLRALLIWAHWFLLTSTIVVVCAVLVWASLTIPDDLFPMAIAILFVPLVALGNLRGAILRGLGHDLIGQFPEHAIRPFLFVCSLALLYAFSLDLTLVSVFSAQIAAAAGATLVGFLIYWRLRPGMPKAALPPGQVADWGKALFFMGSTSGLIVINSSVDIVMLGFWTSDSEVGAYRLAATVAGLFTLGLQTMNTFAMPYLSRHMRTGEFLLAARVAQQSAQVSFGLALAGLAFVVVLGSPGLALIFGPGFEHAFPLLLILAIGNLTNAFFGPVADVLMMGGDEKLVATVTGLSTVANVVLNFLLIPEFGAVGAATSASITIVLSRLVLFEAVSRRRGFRSWPLAF